MTRWFAKSEPLPPEVVEKVEPLEIPVIIEVNRRLERGDYRAAVRLSYPVVASDCAKAFRIPFPPYWTHEEFLRSLETEKVGTLLPEFLGLFYQVYSPIRYGPPGAPIRYGVMAHGPATSVNKAARGAGTARAAESHALSARKDQLVDKVTQSPRRRPHGVPPSASPRLIEEAVRVFLALGVTAEDLHLWAKPGSAFVQVADAMNTRAGAS